MKPIPTFSDVQTYIDHRQFIQQTADQIIKDFDWVQYNIHFSDNKNPYQELMGQIIPIVRELITFKFGELMNLLYLIDVNEAELKKQLNQRTQEDSAFIIADLIIKRELLKILIRNHFKTQS